MPLAPGERQGYLGNLEEKTVTELKDLLIRQETLLSKQYFLKILPDKGLKVKQFAESLEKLIQQKTLWERTNKVDDFIQTGSSFTVINPTSAFSSFQNKQCVDIPLIKNEHTVDNMNTNDQLISLINPAAILGSAKKQILDERINEENITDSLSASLQNVKVSDNNEITHSTYKPAINCFEQVIRRAEQRPKNSREPFKPHSSLMISKLDHLPEKYKFKSKNKESKDMDCDGHINKTINASVFKEESAACPPQYKYNKIKQISTQEARELLKQQTVKQEELRAQHAAARLTERLHVKMEPYNPDIVDMGYRKPVCDSDDDDDDCLNNTDINNTDCSKDDDKSFNYPD